MTYSPPEIATIDFTIARQLWDQDRARFNAMGWKIGDEVYLNGGVLLFNDTPKSHEFSAEWHRRWFEFTRQG